MSRHRDNAEASLPGVARDAGLYLERGSAFCGIGFYLAHLVVTKVFEADAPEDEDQVNEVLSECVQAAYSEAIEEDYHVTAALNQIGGVGALADYVRVASVPTTLLAFDKMYEEALLMVCDLMAEAAWKARP